MTSNVEVQLLAMPRSDAAFALLGIAGKPTTLGVEVASSFRARLRGWLGRAEAPPSRGLWIAPCDGVHTFAMHFPIDLVFVDAFGVVKRIDRCVRPWRVRICIGALSVIELAAGQTREIGIEIADRLELRSV